MDTTQKKSYLYLYGGAIGETLYGIHLARTLAANDEGAQLQFLSTRENPMARSLVEPLTFATYVECPKYQLRSWLQLLSLLRRNHCIIVHQPLSGTMPLWWHLILLVATLRSGSIEVRVAPSTTAHQVPPQARSVIYNPASDQIFDTVPRVLTQWGFVTAVTPPVSLDAALYAKGILAKRDRLVFHFFAPSNKRSIPVEKAREILSAVKKQFPNVSLALTVDHAHRDVAQAMTEGEAVEILENLPLPQLIETIATARVYVGVDTGITHLASALNTEVVVLGNWSNPCWLPTYSRHAHIFVERANCICNGDKTGDCYYEVEGSRRYRCMMDIRTGTIIDTIGRALSSNAHA